MTPARPGRPSPHGWRALFVAAVLVNLAVLYWPRTVTTTDGLQLDKLGHLVVFAAVAWTGLRSGTPARWLLPALVLHAAASELVQAVFLAGRSGDAADVVADLAGVLAGTLLARASWRDERPAPSPRGG